MTKVIPNIQDYEIIGTVADNGWLYANRELLESHIRDDMRNNNILPILDMPINIYCSLNNDGYFDFSIRAAGYETENVGEFLGILIKDGVLVGANAEKVQLYEGL